VRIKTKLNTDFGKDIFPFDK